MHPGYVPLSNRNDRAIFAGEMAYHAVYMLIDQQGENAELLRSGVGRKDCQKSNCT